MMMTLTIKLNVSCAAAYLAVCRSALAVHSTRAETLRAPRLTSAKHIGHRTLHTNETKADRHRQAALPIRPSGVVTVAAAAETT